jgi:predicted small lipoprotein YifL
MAHAIEASLANDTHSGILRKISEPALPRPRRTLSVVALIGAVALALPLAACGRKGPLDPPPGGYALEQGTAQTPVSGAGVTRPKDTQPEYDEAGRPIVRQGPKRKLPADWLID